MPSRRTPRIRPTTSSGSAHRTEPPLSPGQRGYYNYLKRWVAPSIHDFQKDTANSGVRGAVLSKLFERPDATRFVRVFRIALKMDPNPTNRGSAAEALRRLGSTRSLGLFIEKMKDREEFPNVRFVCALAIGQLGTKKQIEQLRAWKNADTQGKQLVRLVEGEYTRSSS